MSDAPQVANAEPGPLRLLATMSLAGLMSGLVIVTVFNATLPGITAHKAELLREAVIQVLPGTSRIQRMVWRQDQLIAAENGAADEAAIFAGFNATGELIGYAIPGTGSGFQDTIRLLYGYHPKEGRIVGLQILDSKETPGSGDKIAKDPDFKANFNDLAVSPKIEAVKKGKKSAPYQIDAITGATISSKAVVRILNEANALWLPRLPNAR
jgi:Na+-translocating ferredoxin:NAD+ oxidoreductase subunit G